MKIKDWPVTIKDGKITTKDGPSFERAMSFLSGEYYLTLDGQSRSSNANSLYWLWLHRLEATIGRDQGYYAEDYHDIFRSMFLKGSKTVSGKVYETVGSSAILDTAEFNEYMNKVQRFASTEWGITLE